MLWDHLADQGSCIFCPPEEEYDDPLVYKAGLPVLSPPDIPDSMLDAKVTDVEAQGLIGEEVPEKELSSDHATTEDEERKQATTHINITSFAQIHRRTPPELALRL